VAMGRPVGIKAGGFGRDGDVVGQLTDDLAVPPGRDLLQGLLGVEQRRFGHLTVKRCVHELSGTTARFQLYPA